MTIANYMNLFALCAASAIYGCRRPAAPPYDNQQAKALLDACEAIVEDRMEDAMEAVDRLDESAGADDFASSARLAIERKMEFAKADLYLQQLDLQGLKEFIALSRSKGTAGAGLDAFAGLSDALAELSLFRRRMPWEKSADLKAALESLRRHDGILAASVTYRDFVAAQELSLKELEEGEALVRAGGYLGRMEAALVSGDLQGFHEAEGDFRRDQPGHAYFAMLETLSAGSMPGDLKKGDVQAFEVASSAKWNTLSEDARKGAWGMLERSGGPQGVCGMLVKAMHGGRLEDYEALFARASGMGLGVSRDIAASYAALLGGGRPGQASPCTGITEVIGIVKDTKEKAK